MIQSNEELNHPCRDTCSGWQQGYDKGVASAREEIERLKLDPYPLAKKLVKSEKELQLEREISAVYREALEFYAEGHNLDIDGITQISWPSSPSHRNWRIGPPYITSAEMGQTAREALLKAEEMRDKK